MAGGQRHRCAVVLSGSGDQTVRVWDLDSGQPVVSPFTGHDGEVTAVAVGQRRGRPVIVSGGFDRTVRVWDLDSGESVLGPLTGHEGAVRTVAIGQLKGRPVIISGGTDQTVQVWDLESKPHSTLRIELQHQVQSVAATANRLVIGTTAELLRVDLL